MKFLIAGGTGLVGEALTSLLVKKNHQVHILSRSKHKDQPGIKYFYWDPTENEMNEDCFDGVDVLVNLSGAGIADKRWTPSRKKQIIDSRVVPTDFLFKKVKDHKVQLKKYISASGINCYGWENKEKVRQEEDAFGDDFLSKVVKVWEQSADQFNELTDVVKMRISMVLSEDGGALNQLGKLTRWRVGSKLADGKQYIQWVHIDDLVASILHFSLNKEKGAYNISTDANTTNKEFMKVLNSVLNKSPLVPPAPRFALKLMLGEMSEMLLEGIKVSNTKIKDTGFKFKYNTIEKALIEIYS